MPDSLDTETSPPRAWMFALSVSLLGIAGCEEAVNQLGGKCSDVEKSYRQTLEDEKTELDSESGQDSDRAHLGLTLSNDLLSTVINRALNPVIKGALNLTSNLPGGFGIEPSGQVANIEIEANNQCDHCFKVTIGLGGSLALNGPAGTTNVPLDGQLRMIAPLDLKPGEEKSAALELDMNEEKKILKSRLDAQLDQLPRWASSVRQPIQNQLNTWADKLVSNVTSESVTLVEFDGPSFGIPDFEIFPVQLKTEAASNSVFAGFATNVAALNQSDISAITPVTELNADQNMALSFQPELIVNALSLLIGIDEVSRTYSLSGRANPDGGLHVTLDQFRIGGGGEPSSGSADAGLDASTMASSGSADARMGGGSSGGGVPVALGFKLHQFNQGGFCFSAGARASGNVAVDSGSLTTALENVEFTSSSAPRDVVNLANWAGAQFIGESEELVKTSLNGNNIEVSNSELDLGPLDVGLQPNTLVLRGNSDVRKPSEGDDN